MGAADRRGSDAHLEHPRRLFYLIVGVHGLHALAAHAALGSVLLRLRRSVLPSAVLTATALFWYFVVGVWPVIYARVYA